MDFFNQINLLYGSITEFCTDASCPIMSAGPKVSVARWGVDDAARANESLSSMSISGWTAFR